jgi:hypothetical protein
MLIVLEGVDKGGKTSVVRALSKLHLKTGRGQFTCLHQGPPPEGVNLVEHYERPLLQPEMITRCLSTEDLVVLDRWHVGELVYGPLLRGGSRLTEGAALHVELLLQSLGATQALVQPYDVQETLKRHRRQPDLLLTSQQASEVAEWYRVYAVHRDNWYQYDSGAASATELALELLQDSADYTREVLPVATAHPSYLGDPQPDVLLVGDTRSNGADALTWTTKPFTPAATLSSSTWLMDALAAAPVPPTMFGLVNAREPGVQLRKLWSDLGEPRVVALGNEAVRAMKENKLEYTKMCHPQWARRFRHSHREDYAKALRRVVVDGDPNGDW